MIHGTIIDVSTGTVGEYLTADVAAAATALPITDGRTFDENGGMVRLGSNIYTYTAVTDNVLTLAGGLAQAALTDDLVEIYPPATVKRALVDLGDDNEAIWAMVPQTLVTTLPDGLRYDGQRESVALEERSPGEVYLADVPAQAAVAASTVLGEGAVAPDRLNVGVTGNLVQDPAFTGAYWTPPRKWSVVGPDAVYTDSNFIRSTGTTEANIPHDGGDADDWDFWLTGLVPVDPGRSVRVAAKMRRDAASLTSGVGTPRARVRVVFYKEDRITYQSTLAELTELVLIDETVADTWIPLELTCAVPEGYAYFKAGVQTGNQQNGTVDFIKPEIVVLWDRVQSASYVQGSAGWSLDDQTAQFENVNVLSELGADTISTRSLLINGVDLETEFLTPLPLGIVAYDSKGSPSTSNTDSTGITELKFFEFSGGTLAADRLYRIRFKGHLDNTVANDVFDIRMRYTVDGTTPTVSSPLLRSDRFPMGATATGRAFETEKMFTTATPVRLRIALCLQRTTGTGVGSFTLSNGQSSLFAYIEDCGLYANAAAAGTLSVKDYADATPPDPDPINNYTRTYWATWTRSYDSGGGTRSGDDGPECYQGYYSGTHGNTRSLVGFDYGEIQGDLAGATITSVKLTFRVQHSSLYAGMKVLVSSHNYSSKPSTWNGANVNEGRANRDNCKEGSTYTVSLGTAVGNEFKSGSTRGIGFGPGTTNNTYDYYGYLYGGTSSGNRPRLTISFKK